MNEETHTLGVTAQGEGIPVDLVPGYVVGREFEHLELINEVARQQAPDSCFLSYVAFGLRKIVSAMNMHRIMPTHL